MAVIPAWRQEDQKFNETISANQRQMLDSMLYAIRNYVLWVQVEECPNLLDPCGRMEHEGRLPSVGDICLESYVKIRKHDVCVWRADSNICYFIDNQAQFG